MTENSTLENDQQDNLGRELAGMIEWNALLGEASAPDANNLAMMSEGTLSQEQRDQLMGRALASPMGLTRLRMAIEAEHGAEPSKVVRFYRARQWFPAVASLAAALLLVFLFPLSVPDNRYLEGSLEMPSAIVSILNRSDSGTWTGPEDLDSWAAALWQEGIDIDRKHLEEVTLEGPYVQTKSLFGAREKLVYRLEDGILYIRISYEKPEREP